MTTQKTRAITDERTIVRRVIITLEKDNKTCASKLPYCKLCSGESPFHLNGCPDSPEASLVTA